MKNIVLIAALAFSLNSFCQVIWGVGSANPNYDDAGRFASAFGSGNGWVPNGVSSPTALWTKSTNGLSQGAYATTLPAIGSPSQSDGCALFDSDFLDNNGVQGAFGTGTCPSPHKGELLSPTFDLTGNSNASISAKMFLYSREFVINEMSVGFSSDNGATWSDVSISQSLPTNIIFYGAFIEVPLPNVLTGVTDLTQCKVRLTFDGDYYFLMVDDISIQVLNTTADIAVATSDVMYDFKTSASPAPYKTMPLQVAKTYAPYNAAVLVKNLGFSDIPVTSNPKVNYDLSKKIAGNWTSLINANLSIPNPILMNDTASVQTDITNAMQAAFNANGVGDYRFTYVVSHDLADLSSSNDTTLHYFTITPDYSWYSSSPLLSDGGPASTSSNFPGTGAGNVIQELEWGSFYYFPDISNIAIDSVKYRMKVPANFNLANPNVPITIKFSKWVDGNNNQVIDYANGELELKTLTLDTLAIDNSNLDTFVLGSVRLVDPNNINPVTFVYDMPYPLGVSQSTDGLFYLSVAQQNINGLVDVNGNVNCVYPGVNEMPYEWSKAFSSYANTPLKVVEGAPNSAGNVSWYEGFAGAYVAPSTALHLIDYASYLAVSENNTIADLQLFPNPATTTVAVRFESKIESSIVRYILTDASGRVVKMEVQKNPSQADYVMDIANLPAGSYFIHVKSDKSNVSLPFVKQ